MCCFKYSRVVAHDNTLRLGSLVLQLPARAKHWSWAGQRLEARQHLDGAWSVHAPDGRELLKQELAEREDRGELVLGVPLREERRDETEPLIAWTLIEPALPPERVHDLPHAAHRDATELDRALEVALPPLASPAVRRGGEASREIADGLAFDRPGALQPHVGRGIARLAPFRAASDLMDTAVAVARVPRPRPPDLTGIVRPRDLGTVAAILCDAPRGANALYERCRTDCASCGSHARGLGA